MSSVRSSYVSFDLGMLSKYQYYTGMVFKAYTYGVGEAVVKGGRYDRLLLQFGKDAPAVGFVVVVDTIMEALSRQEARFPAGDGIRRIFYGQGDFAERLAEAQKLRAEGIPVELLPLEGACSGEEVDSGEGAHGREALR